MSDLSKKLRMYALHDGHSSDVHVNMCEVMHKSADALEARDKTIAELVDAVSNANSALTMWLATYADDMVGEKAAEDAKRIIMESGGTIAFIADATKVCRDALSQAQSKDKAE